MKKVLYYSLMVYFICYSSLSLAQMHCLETVSLDKPVHCQEMESSHQKLLQAKLCDMQCGVFKTVYNFSSLEFIPESPENQLVQGKNFSSFDSLSFQPLLRPPIQALI